MRYGLDSIFNPRSIAVVGSFAEGKVGYELVKNLLSMGYPGKIFPVSRRGEEVFGLRIFRSLEELPEVPELALVAVPAWESVKVVKEAVELGTKSAVVFSSGFAEIGAVELEEELRRLAREYGIRIVGPNCAGVVCTWCKLYASFEPPPKEGNVAIISQSGAFAAVVLEYMKMKGLGISVLVSYGNRADVGEAELLRFLAEDDRTKVVLMYLEGLAPGAGREFMESARRLGKPLVVLKVGAGEVSARAAASHTASIAGDYSIYLSALRQIGAVVVDDYVELVDVGEALLKSPEVKTGEVLVVTNSGGPAALVAHHMDLAGIPLREPPRDFVERLDLPPYVVKGNPLDLTGSATPDQYYYVIKQAMEDERIGIILAIHVPPSFADPLEVAKAVRDASRDARRRKPLLALFLGPRMFDAWKELEEFPRPLTHKSAVTAVRSLLEYSKRAKKWGFPKRGNYLASTEGAHSST